MRKEVLCKKCNNRIRIKSWANDRVELAREKGDTFEVTCKKCHKTQKYSINEVSAYSSSFINAILLIAVFVLMAGTGYYLFSNYWGISFYMIFALPLAIAIPGMIYFTYVKSKNNKIRNFNRFRI